MATATVWATCKSCEQPYDVDSWDSGLCPRCAGEVRVEFREFEEREAYRLSRRYVSMDDFEFWAMPPGFRG